MHSSYVKEPEISVHFEDIGWEIRKLLINAKSSIKICVAWIGWKVYKDALVDAAQRRVKVELIYNFDEKTINVDANSIPGIDFYPIAMPSRRTYMHNKFCIIDDNILITGSFNWSRAAEHHFENIIVIKDSYKAIKEYLYEFYELIDYFHYHQRFPMHERCMEKKEPYNLLCRSHVYNIGLFGQESGRHSESEAEIWRFCNSGQHTEFLGSYSENFLMTQLGLTGDDFNDDRGDYLDKETMLEQVQRERQQNKIVYNYFAGQNSAPVHAIGFITTVQPTHKYDDGPYDTEIHMIWRNPYYRKIIPSVFHNDGTIDAILDRMRPNG